MKSIGPYVEVRVVSPVPAGSLLPDATANAGAAAGAAQGSGQGSRPRTFWVTDRLTGMPALLRELPAPIPAPELPPHSALLPFHDLVVDGYQAYLVSELPLHAAPARDALLTAQTALSALDTLHSNGFAHGAIDAGQLWSVDGRVLLAGAGLHRLGGEYTAERDLRDLGQTLQSLGGQGLGGQNRLPPEVVTLVRRLQQPGSGLSARSALQMLVGPQAADQTVVLTSETHFGAGVLSQPALSQSSLPQPSPARPANRPTPSLQTTPTLSMVDLGAALPQQGQYLQAAWATATDAPPDIVRPTQTHLATEVSQSFTTSGAVSAPAVSGAGADTAGDAAFSPDAFRLDISQWDIPDFLGTPATSLTDPGTATPATSLVTPLVASSKPVTLQWASPNRTSTSGIYPAPQSEHGEGEVLESIVVAAAPQIPTQNQNQAPSQNPARPARRTAGAAAGRAFERLRADASRLQALAQARRDQQPADWQTASEQALSEQGSPVDAAGEVASSENPQERRRREQQAIQQEAQRDQQEREQRKHLWQEQANAASGSAASGGEQDDQTSPHSLRQLKPIHATWRSEGGKEQRWHVIREGDPVTLSRSAVPGWLWPLLLSLVLAALVIGGLTHRHTAPTATATTNAGAACCTVHFALQGSAARNKTARLTLVQAPTAAKLPPGEALGTAPGEVRFPAPGDYVVQVSLDGFAPATVKVTAPSQQTVNINLGS